MIMIKNLFCGSSMGSNQYWAGRVYDMCVYYMTGAPEGSLKVVFMQKPGVEPTTPGLQDIGLSPTPQRLHNLKLGFFLKLKTTKVFYFTSDSRLMYLLQIY